MLFFFHKWRHQNNSSFIYGFMQIDILKKKFSVPPWNLSSALLELERINLNKSSFLTLKDLIVPSPIWCKQNILCPLKH